MILVRLPLVFVPLLAAAPAAAQTTQGARDTAEAYGVRLNNPADPAIPLNTRRYNSRIENRVENRLQLRVERFRVGASSDPVGAYQRSQQGSATQAFEQADTAGRRADTERPIAPPPRDPDSDDD